MIDETVYRALTQRARQRKTTISACVRLLLANALPAALPKKSPNKIRAALDKAMTYRAPAPDIDQMNAEIEQGYLSGDWPR